MLPRNTRHTILQSGYLTGSVTQLVLAIISKDTQTQLEHWVFDIKLVVEPPAESEERFKVFIYPP